MGCPLSSIPRTWETTGGDHRWWTRTGTQSAKPSTRASRERRGKYVLQVCGNRPGGLPASAEHQSQGQDLVEEKRSKEANGEEDYDQGRERPIESRVAVRQAMW